MRRGSAQPKTFEVHAARLRPGCATHLAPSRRTAGIRTPIDGVYSTIDDQHPLTLFRGARLCARKEHAAIMLFTYLNTGDRHVQQEQILTHRPSQQ
jgi:hypothetical protein